MSDPTVEEVREALDFWTTPQSQEQLMKPQSIPPLDAVLAAARLWVDAAEPDIEAAQQFLDAVINNLLPKRHNLAIDVTFVLAAAFGDNTLIRRADR